MPRREFPQKYEPVNLDFTDKEVARLQIHDCAQLSSEYNAGTPYSRCKEKDYITRKPYTTFTSIWCYSVTACNTTLEYSSTEYFEVARRDIDRKY